MALVACQGRNCGTRMATGLWRVRYRPRNQFGEMVQPPDSYEKLCAECGFSAIHRRTVFSGTTRMGKRTENWTASASNVERVDLVRTLRI
jgi:hypothetical protein